jgi:hypothetical protein
MRIGSHGIGYGEELLDVSPFELADTQDVATGKLHALHSTFAPGKGQNPGGLSPYSRPTIRTQRFTLSYSHSTRTVGATPFPYLASSFYRRPPRFVGCH